MRPLALVPLACAIVGFIVSMLCLFAGHKPGFMEDYHIITVNTSSLGHNILQDKATTTSAAPKSSPTSVGSFISGTFRNITDSVEDDINGLLNDAADKLAKKLGIKQWYSLHLMDLCDGSYTPNATAQGTNANVSSCSNQTAMYRFDITTPLNRALENGPLHINLTTLHFPTEIQDGLDSLSMALNATFVFYAIGIAAAGLVVIISLISFFAGSSILSICNIVVSVLSFFALLVASIIITVLQAKAVKLLNNHGNDVGLYAYKGGKYLILTWVATAAMAVAMMVSVGELVMGKRQRQREFSEKPQGKGYFGRRKRSDEAGLRKSGV
ncbi:Uncharacterized protein BP5553_09360 [Venustampulla echinocandica]|uniref:Sur7 protein n=1 Tax=Venustampulla echinocandica TaxID=2656787 RepID=A0A370TCI3_9HELO|nr:Uncharacterized protein BP5553_09360 [Venustampulla echinocandica]RDL31958.1 Uncharacterized protein BP5553_09360 [Venustampulla echinocandica]